MITKISDNTYERDGVQYTARSFMDLLNHFDLVSDHGIDEQGEDTIVFETNELFDMTTTLVAEYFEGLGLEAVADGQTIHFPRIFTTVELAKVLVSLTGFTDLRPIGRERAAMSNSREGVFLRCCCFLEYVFGYQTGYTDEHERCSDCYTIIYLTDNHGRYRYSKDCELTCRKCDEKNPERYLSEYLEEQKKCADFIIDPKLVGFEVVGSQRPFMGESHFDPLQFERGLHLDSRDNPKKCLKLLQSKGIDEVLFCYDTDMFTVRWSIAVRPEHLARAFDLLSSGGEALKDAKGPGDYAKVMLETAAVEMNKGVAHIHLDIPPPE